MFKFFSFIQRRSSGPWFYPLISITVAFSIWISSAPATQAISWRDLIFRGIQVIQLTTLSNQQEVALGRQINEQLVKSEIKLLQNPQATEYINQIGQRLAETSERSNIPYTFQVVNDSSINAFATMGGFVYVNTGLMKAAENEAELASVIAHEIGHIVGRHSVEQMRQMAVAQGVASAAGLDASLAVQIGVELALRRPNSRKAEYEADQFGITNLGKAGYDQQAAVSFMKKLLQAGSVPTILSTHPATNDRISALEAMINPSFTNNGSGMDSAAYQSKVQRLL
ncbi:M48 family metallopeptidase [Limnoraphis robusta]|uniref:M48 family metallopeptidase n=1 Tax=Limnoraphis robusta TaxID=1118279 RepID=UPI002B2118ED|nr:M48 family metallopeptidase [Limnoraphis robusta]MEA5498007.1 M48 family metallopeptidase [Limnoraphis robusta BA-68 BA1]